MACKERLHQAPPVVRRGLVEGEPVAADLQRDRGPRVPAEPSLDRHHQRRHRAGEGHDQLGPLQRAALRPRRRPDRRLGDVVDPVLADFLPEAPRELRALLVVAVRIAGDVHVQLRHCSGP
jgi:hypothetical protein